MKLINAANSAAKFLAVGSVIAVPLVAHLAGDDEIGLPFRPSPPAVLMMLAGLAVLGLLAASAARALLRRARAGGVLAGVLALGLVAALPAAAVAGAIVRREDTKRATRWIGQAVASVGRPSAWREGLSVRRPARLVVQPSAPRWLTSGQPVTVLAVPGQTPARLYPVAVVARSRVLTVPQLAPHVRTLDPRRPRRGRADVAAPDALSGEAGL